MTDAQLRATAAAWLAAGRPAMEVQVLSHRGSVPRETGTRMLVSLDAVDGTVGGGHLELKAIERARELLRAGARPDAAPDDRHYPLGPALGQCCGGALTLRTQRLTAAGVAAWPHDEPLFTLQLYGAGHVGRAIVRVLAGIDCRVQWIDEREAEFPPGTLSACLAPPAAGSTSSLPLAGGGSGWGLDGGAPGAPPPADVRPPPQPPPCQGAGVQAAQRDAGHGEIAALPAHVEAVCVDPVEAEVDIAPPGAFYLVLTHSHDLDLRITEAILRRGDFGYLGLIGSATKRARFLHRYEARGVPAEALARMTCPIGVPGITGKQPDVIAVSVVAQLLQVAEARRRASAPAAAAQSL